MKGRTRFVGGNCGMSSRRPSSFTPSSKCSPDACSTRVPVVLLQVPILMPPDILQGVRSKSLPILPCPLHEFEISGAREFPAVQEECVHHSGAQVMHQRVLRSPWHEPALQIASRPCLFLQWVWWKSRHQVVWWACARRIALFPSAAHLPTSPPPLLASTSDVIRTAVHLALFQKSVPTSPLPLPQNGVGAGTRRVRFLPRGRCLVHPGVVREVISLIFL